MNFEAEKEWRYNFLKKCIVYGDANSSFYNSGKWFRTDTELNNHIYFFGIELQTYFRFRNYRWYAFSICPFIYLKEQAGIDIEFLGVQVSVTLFWKF